MEYHDLSEEQITKRQHYVPKAYLKHFSLDEKKTPHVYAVFPNKSEPQTVSIEKICCQSYLYDQIAVDPDSGAHVFVAPNQIEDIFSSIESRYAAIIEKLKADLKEKNDFELTSEEIGTLRGFLSSLLWRNPIFVHISNCIVDREYAQDPEYIEHLQNILPDVPPNVAISYMANEFLKKYLFLATLAMADTMRASQLCIFRTQDSVFITSDMPVVNIYGETNGIVYDLVGTPITPELFVAFIDTEYDLPKVLSIDCHSVMRINSRQKKANNILISNKRDLLSFIDFSYSCGEEDNDGEGLFWQSLKGDREKILKEYREIMDSEKIKFWR